MFEWTPCNHTVKTRMRQKFDYQHFNFAVLFRKIEKWEKRRNFSGPILRLTNRLLPSLAHSFSLSVPPQSDFSVFHFSVCKITNLLSQHPPALCKNGEKSFFVLGNFPGSGEREMKSCWAGMRMWSKSFFRLTNFAFSPIRIIFPANFFLLPPATTTPHTVLKWRK